MHARAPGIRSSPLGVALSFVGLAGVAALVALLAGAPVARSAFPGANGNIAFNRYKGHNDIYTIAPDGTHPRRLTRKSNNAGEFPAFSVDGRRIAFTGRPGFEDEEIYVMRANGTHRRRLTDNASGDGSPAFAPDGEHIAFKRAYSNGDGEIFVMRADGTHQRRLTHTHNSAEDYNPAFSPNGKRVAFVSDRDNPNGDIYLMRSNGTDQRRLTHDPAGAQSPDWGVKP